MRVNLRVRNPAQPKRKMHAQRLPQAETQEKPQVQCVLRRLIRATIAKVFSAARFARFFRRKTFEWLKCCIMARMRCAAEVPVR